MARRKNIYVIAGSNGAGKTTFATVFLPRYVACTRFVNPDLIARGLSPFDPAAAGIGPDRIRQDHQGDAVMKKTRDSMETKALRALDEAVVGVIERYRRQKRRLAVWRDGKVVRITAAEAARVREARDEYRAGVGGSPDTRPTRIRTRPPWNGASSTGSRSRPGRK